MATTTGSKSTYTDMQNPLFLHLSDGPQSIMVTKFQGAGDYRAWRRTFEVQLSAKESCDLWMDLLQEAKLMQLKQLSGIPAIIW